MQVGTGKSILNGIAIGKLKIYKKKDTVISTAQVADTAAEEARFEEARAKAIDQQTALYEKALAEAGEDIAEVFNIHAMMLDDDDFVDAIKEIINGQHMCAEYAVKKAGDNQAAVFAAMDDPYLQARSADVIDIAQAMLDILQGVDNATLQGTEPSILVAEEARRRSASTEDRGSANCWEKTGWNCISSLPPTPPEQRVYNADMSYRNRLPKASSTA